MATMTLLEMVKDIMSDMESDEVSAIADTDEAEQVAQTIRTVYYQIITKLELPEHYSLLTLTSAASTLTPTQFTIPTDVTDINWFKYNKIQSGGLDALWRDLVYLKPQKFVELTHSRASSDTTNIQTVNMGSGNLPVYIDKRKAPEYYTSFDDNLIICDSYDIAVDTQYLQTNKTMVWAQTPPIWSSLDAAVPDLDEKFFPYFLAEAKATCFVNIKQQSNAKIEKQARDQLLFLQDNKWRTKDANKKTGPNYGRK